MNNIKYNASNLFYSKGLEPSFIPNIDISEAQKKQLMDARKQARSAIKSAFRDAHPALKEKWNSKTEKANGEFKEIIPAFWVQGSYSYHTVNHPPSETVHQIDLDDGVYLPTDILDKKPIIYKQAFFEIVDSALKVLCANNQLWEFSTKNTCARITINPLMHLDFPLYAIPREEFYKIQKNESLLARNCELDDSFSRKLLDGDHVFLAVRDDKHWIKSDPRKIKKWFDDEIHLHGRVLRRVCRYIKAWRDYTWPSGGDLTSITLMACVVESFNQVTNFKNESSALLFVANNLAKQLKKNVNNPAETEYIEQLFPRNLSITVQNDIVVKTEEMASHLTYALCHAENKKDSLNYIRLVFGDRIPYDRSCIRSCNTNGLAAPIKKQDTVIMAEDIKSG